MNLNCANKGTIILTTKAYTIYLYLHIPYSDSNNTSPRYPECSVKNTGNIIYIKKLVKQLEICASRSHILRVQSSTDSYQVTFIFLTYVFETINFSQIAKFFVTMFCLL